VEEKTMKGRIILASFVLVALSAVTAAQMPQPGPEQNRLHYYAGTWSAEYEMKAGPMGPGGKMMSTDSSEMMPGGFFLVTHTEGKGSMGELKGLAVMGYDAESKSYTYDSYNNFGEAEHFKGTVQGDTWTWTSEGNMGGKMVKMRFIAKEVSPKQYTMRLEMMSAGNWLPVMSGRATKTK
jgi:uncharacterized protein DUF1579